MKKSTVSTLYRARTSHKLSRLLDARITAYLNSLSSRHLEERKHRMAVYANDYVGILINQHGYYERDELDFLFTFLKPLLPRFAESAALDIGANIGNHSVYFSRYFAAVHAFEPNPSTFRLLAINAEWPGNVIAHNCALGDEIGVLPLAEYPTNFGRSSLRYSAGRGSVQVHVKRLDDLAWSAPEIALIKIDVEGFEANVIRGGMETLRRFLPIVVLEQDSSEFVDGSTESIRLLRQLGYRFCWHESGSPSSSWLVRRFTNVVELLRGRSHSAVTADAVPPNSYSMLIALPPRICRLLGMQE